MDKGQPWRLHLNLITSFHTLSLNTVIFWSTGCYNFNIWILEVHNWPAIKLQYSFCSNSITETVLSDKPLSLKASPPCFLLSLPKIVTELWGACVAQDAGVGDGPRWSADLHWSLPKTWLGCAWLCLGFGDGPLVPLVGICGAGVPDLKSPACDDPRSQLVRCTMRRSTLSLSQAFRDVSFPYLEALRYQELCLSFSLYLLASLCTYPPCLKSTSLSLCSPRAWDAAHTIITEAGP
jgi:hypothetical protein